MMWKEFEELAGYEVSYRDYYDVIEPMYLATSLSKADFIKCLDKKRFALKTKRQLVGEMRKTAEAIRDEVEHTGAYALKETLRKQSYDYASRFYGFDPQLLDWYCYTNVGYSFPGMRGCSFPVEIVIGYKDIVFESIQLIKD